MITCLNINVPALYLLDHSQHNSDMAEDVVE